MGTREFFHLKQTFAFRDVAGEGCWCLSTHLASGPVTLISNEYTLCLPNETLEWGKQYEFSLFENPDANLPRPPGSVTITITPTVRPVQEGVRARGGRGSFLAALAERHAAHADGEA